MSAYVALVHPDRVELVSDGATYLPDGTMVLFNCKIHTSEYVPAAMTARGRVMTTRPMQEQLLDDMSEGSFDEAIDEFRERLAFMKRVGGVAPCELAIAGISETRGPIFYGVASVPYEGREAFELFESRSLICDGTVGGAASIAQMRAYGGLQKFAKVFMQGLRAMPRREAPEWDPDNTAEYIVGGHLDMATVTRAGVRVERIHTWPEDKIGEKIRPRRSKVDVASVLPAGLNRAQRRQAEKMLRKELAVH